jgi:hypothetical protein
VTYFLTPSGSSIQVVHDGMKPHPDRDAHQHWLRVTTDAGTVECVCVLVVIPDLINSIVSQSSRGITGDVGQALSVLRVVRSFDDLASVQPNAHGARTLEVTPDNVTDLIEARRVSDRTVRQYLARRVYDQYSRSILNTSVDLGDAEMRILGINAQSLVRNAQVLEAEGYFNIQSNSGSRVLVRPTVKLVRDVERYGGPREDATSERDYAGAVNAYPNIKANVPALLLEYQRYITATSAIELESVFKSVAPIVEMIAKDLLAASGSNSQHSTLGPVLNELHSRGVGGVALASQLNHILKFGRDLAQHGVSLPEPVLRIACENAFELVPQLGALFPRP